MLKFDIGHYTDFKLPSNSDIPEQLQQTLQLVSGVEPLKGLNSRNQAGEGIGIMRDVY